MLASSSVEVQTVWNSDRGRIVSGSIDQSISVWDKKTLQQFLTQLKGHSSRVSSVRMLSGECLVTASHDGTMKIWDLRTDTCVAHCIYTHFVRSSNADFSWV